MPLSSCGIVLLSLALSASTPAGAQAPPAPQPAVVETGVINGAPFRIDVPPEWNKGLVMYAHGYATEPPDLDAPPMRALREVFLSRGFAVAQSAFGAQGWAVKEGIEDTEALRRHFVRLHGEPLETYMTGHSMGGHIAIATLERYPDAYQGAMPMCGPLGPAIEFFEGVFFDMLVTFEALFPGTIGSPYEPGEATVEKVRAAIVAEPQRSTRYALRFARPVERLPETLHFFQLILAELKLRAGGEPFDNRNRIYNGFGDDVALNRRVKRYTADPEARAYVLLYASPNGRISDPVLAIHTTGDPVVLGNDVTAYERAATFAGTSDLFVARFVPANGHCNFTPEQTGAAFDALRAWAREGKRPSSGEHR